MPTNKFERHKFAGAKLVSVQGYGQEIKIFELDLELEAEPGQFIMLWLPGIGERPFCPTRTSPLELAVKKRGLFTKKIFELKPGSFVGVRGPYGRGFRYKDVKRACLVAGGIGVAALIRLAEVLSQNRAKLDFVYGAKNIEQLIFLDRIEMIAKPFISTDDGSFGESGSCVQVLEDLLEDKRYDCVYCCGPEPMMAKVLLLCKKYNIESQFALERKIKCGIGLCGHCDFAGRLLCKDGPVFSGKTLAKIKEFGFG